MNLYDIAIAKKLSGGGGGGGSNFKIANVTIISNSFDESYVPNINESATAYLEIESGNTNAQIIVYEDYPTIFEVDNQSVQSVTGDINKPEGEPFALIYGDGTITIG